MRRITTFLLAAGFTGILATGCNSDEKTYSDAEYILFADTMSTNMVFQDEAYFTIPIASTVACDYDRTIGVEVIDKGSTAIEGYHYRLRSNTITIKAGERTANVEVAGYYDHIQDTDSLGFILKLVMPEQLNWSDLYTDYDKTKVVLYKGCPYDPETFTGWCVVTSLLLYDYPSALDTSYQRLILTEKHPTEPNTIILRDFLYDGYDVTMRLNTDDPAEPLVEMDEDQVLSDEQTVLLRLLLQHLPALRHHLALCLPQGHGQHGGRRRQLLQHPGVGVARGGHTAQGGREHVGGTHSAKTGIIAMQTS